MKLNQSLNKYKITNIKNYRPILMTHMKKQVLS